MNLLPIRRLNYQILFTIIEFIESKSTNIIPFEFKRVKTAEKSGIDLENT